MNPSRTNLLSQLLPAAAALALLAGSSAFATPDAAPVKPADTKKMETPATAPAAAPAPKMAADQKAATEYVLVSTSMGDIALELNRDKAPITVDNFMKYVDKGHYDGTIFHRVISTFMIQGGGFDENLNEKPTDAPIKNEWTNGLSHKRGTVAMARKGGPSNVDSATSQFFINVVNNDGSVRNNLDRPQADGAGYCVFGHVVGGMEVVEKIKSVSVGDRAKGPGQKLGDVPTKTVTITSVKRTTKDDAMKVGHMGADAAAAGAKVGDPAKPVESKPVAPKAPDAPKR
ncbi:N/A [soil metagenome]